MAFLKRITTYDWDLYDTRHVVFRAQKLSAGELADGYRRAYEDFYSWSNIAKASLRHEEIKHQLKHFFYAGGWKKFEPLWNFIIKAEGLDKMLPLLEGILGKVIKRKQSEVPLAQNRENYEASL